MSSGIGELDRVLGGGLVAGSVVLVGGEPGVGKSTLLLQASTGLAAAGEDVLLASAEESADQIRMRAERLGVADAGVAVTCEQQVDAVVALAERSAVDVVVVDSIQTMTVPEVAGSAGSVAQVREAAARLVGFAKRSGTAVILVGHVTKDGAIAGPKTLEHMVDVVLYLEGDPDRGMRFLRGAKNRFGSTNEVGVFEMADSGMIPIPDPSKVMVGERDPSVAGTVLFPTVDGRRSLLVEVQALVVPTANPQPRRSAKGLPVARLHQVLAVLDRHAGVSLAAHDVYVSVVGGLRVVEPAIDLPMALAVASSAGDVPVGDVAAWGEVGLTGELRAVAQGSRRRAEALRMGVGQIVTAADGVKRLSDALPLVRAGDVRARRRPAGRGG